MVFRFRKSKDEDNPQPSEPERAEDRTTTAQRGGEVEIEAKRAAPQNHFGEDMSIVGSVTSTSGLTLHGEIEGDVNVTGALIIEPDAVIRGDVRTAFATIAGTVEGDVETSGSLIIKGSGRIVGDVASAALQVEDGGSLLGRCKLGTKAAPPPVATPFEEDLELPGLTYEGAVRPKPAG